MKLLHSISIRTKMVILIAFMILSIITVGFIGYSYQGTTNKEAGTAILTAVIVMSAVAILLGIVVSKSITRPITGIVKIIEETSKLDLRHNEAHQIFKSFKDEIGVIARSVGKLRENLRGITENLSTISGSLAASSQELADSAAENTKTVNQVVNTINEMAVGNNAQADTIAKVSENILSMASRIKDVDKATEINCENSRNSLEAIDEGQKAIDLAISKIRENMEVSDKVEASVTELSSQMDKVVNIIDVIGAISEQTNLLSLNASIEAARAGEAGKGFAVVATEIGKLSKHTADSVNEITQIITETVEKNRETTLNIAKARELAIEQEETIQITKDAFKRIKVSVDEIAVLSEEITKQISQINASAETIANQTQDMSAISQEAAASSEEISATNEEQLASIEMMAASAHELSVMAAELNEEISKFKFQ